MFVNRLVHVYVCQESRVYIHACQRTECVHVFQENRVYVCQKNRMHICQESAVYVQSC